MSKNAPGPPPAWGAVPMLPVAVAGLAGVWIADLAGYPFSVYWLLTAIIVSVVAAVLLLRPAPERWKAILTTCLVILTAFFLFGWRTQATHLPTQERFFTNHYEAGDLLAGKVTAVRPGDTRLRAEISLTHVLKDSTGEQAVVGNLLVYLPPDEQAATLEIGDGIVLNGIPRALRSPLNPGVFDLRAYWSRQGVYHNAFLREAAEWQRIPRSGGGIYARAESWRRAWFKTFQRHLSGDELAVAAALVMGKRDLISQDVQSAYADTGAVHVLAVSGLHVGIIFLILNFLLVKLLRLNRTPAGRWLVTFVSVTCIWLFALISGLSPSVQRAAIMFSVVAAGTVLFRKMDIFNVLSVAALVMLWFNPAQLFAVGFQLSFSAIIGIVLFTSYLDGLWAIPTKILRSAWSAMAASTGAQLGTLPLSLYNFGQFPTYFLLSGTVVILSAFGIMFTGLLHGLVAGFGGDSILATASGQLLGGLVWLQNAFIYFFRDLPGGLLKVPVFPWWLALLLALGIGLLAAWLRWRNRWVGVAGILLFILPLFWARALVQGEVKEAGLVVYHVAKETLVDVPSGDGTAFAFGKEPLARNLAWSAGPNRERRGYQPALTLSLAAADTVLGPALSWQAPYLTVPGERFLVMDGERGAAVPVDLKSVTKILITNGFKPTDFPDISGAELPLVIVDGSNPYYRSAQWRELAEARGFEVWVTGEDGAWVADR